MSCTELDLVHDLGSFADHVIAGDVLDHSEAHIPLWRLDAKKSLSDFKITVTSKSGGTTTYNVHKDILATGARANAYFVKLFTNSPGPMCQLTLAASAATAFPVFLDFCYSSEGKLDAKTHIGAALKYIAVYFGNSALFENICAFIVKDLTWQTAPTYYAEADLYDLEKLSAAAARMCALHFPSADHDELILLKTGLFSTIIESPHLTCDSKLLSRRVADYCRAHSAELTSELLLAITPAKKMPEIAPKEALYLYERAVLYLPQEKGRGSLRQRCMDAGNPFIQTWLKRALWLDLLPCAGDITTAKNEHVIPGFTTQSNLQTAGVEAQQVL
eukprot:CAMPEP_0182545372 /NCGR_PEP_ID=MMETSP1323-20130603/34478_1 /TAXON_ID=236787 /ORGANISM="Florenciella parvula, Strain RCC1693" /LENGTH=330 /DNA_ID=CAMNT_0024756521 /DNA_START=118 /DNA_END=1110 /DNA_ORIENTATION=+